MSGFKFSFDFPEKESNSMEITSNAINQQIAIKEETFKPSSGLHEQHAIQNQQRPQLESIDITRTLSSMKSSPETWKNDVIALSLSPSSSSSSSSPINHNTNGQGWCSLRRIDIQERPFGGLTNEYSSDRANGKSTIHDQTRLNAKHTDLIPGYYEGGLKVWECSIDLCNYLMKLINEEGRNGNGDSVCIKNDLTDALSENGTTLELGCGHGLPACTILKEVRNRMIKKQSENIENTSMVCDNSDGICESTSPLVVFTDYNGFVLRDVTLPNLVLNCDQDYEGIGRYCSLIAGDWLEFSRALKERNSNTCIGMDKDSIAKFPPNGKFDLILAAETTYTLSSANDTAYWLIHHLKPGSGVGFIATKRYYFGVGGGSDAFCDAAKMERLISGSVEYRLDVELAMEYNDGKSNIRDLWRVRCIQIL